MQINVNDFIHISAAKADTPLEICKCGKQQQEMKTIYDSEIRWLVWRLVVAKKILSSKLASLMGGSSSQKGSPCFLTMSRLVCSSRQSTDAEKLSWSLTCPTCLSATPDLYNRCFDSSGSQLTGTPAANHCVGICIRWWCLGLCCSPYAAANSVWCFCCRAAKCCMDASSRG